MMDAAEKTLGKLPYLSAVRTVAKEFLAAKAATPRDDNRLSALGMGGIWCAFNHPKAGEDMRRRVSKALGNKGKAHITMNFSRRGLAFALSEAFIDLDASVAEAAKMKAGVYA